MVCCRSDGPTRSVTAAETLAATVVGDTNKLQNLLNGVPANACGQQNDACAQVEQLAPRKCHDFSPCEQPLFAATLAQPSCT